MNILVFGGTGMLGRRVVWEAARRGHVVYAPKHHEAPLESPVVLGNWITSFGVRADVAINCAGETGDTRRRDIPLAQMVAANALGVAQLVATCQRAHIALAHISTDCVFSGSIGASYRYSVDDTPTPVDLYGASKRLGELAALEQPDALVLRTSFIGPERGLLRWLFDAAKAGERVEGWALALWSGSTSLAVAQAILDAVERGERGVHHLATAQPISKYDLLVHLNEVFGLGVHITGVPEPRCNRALEPTIPLPPLIGALPELVADVRSEVPA